VYDMPISAIARPLQSTVDEDKVQAFMGKIEVWYSGIDMTPIEVMHYEKRHPTTGEELHYYVSVGGCHRWTAHKRLGKETIPARIIEVTEDTLRGYLGASLKLKDDVQEV
ncbi:ParB/Sulfiredoxin, partial [Catenaria anguillulae PL171]